MRDPCSLEAEEATLVLSSQNEESAPSTMPRQSQLFQGLCQLGKPWIKVSKTLKLWSGFKRAKGPRTQIIELLGPNTIDTIVFGP